MNSKLAQCISYLYHSQPDYFTDWLISLSVWLASWLAGYLQLTLTLSKYVRNSYLLSLHSPLFFSFSYWYDYCFRLPFFIWFFQFFFFAFLPHISLFSWLCCYCDGFSRKWLFYCASERWKLGNEKWRASNNNKNNSSSANKNKMFLLFRSFILHSSTFDSCMHTHGAAHVVVMLVSLRMHWIDEQIIRKYKHTHTQTILILSIAYDLFYGELIQYTQASDMAADCNIND